MPLVERLPDVEAAVGVVLRAAGLRSYSSIPGSPTYPLTVVIRAGGNPGEKHSLDGARIQIESWGDEGTDKGTVYDTARDAWQAMLEAEGEIVEAAGERVHLTGVEPEIGPQWIPDPPTKRPRYLFSMRVYARNLGEPS